MFPDDARAIRIGQEVTAITRGAGETRFAGTVEFVEPIVDPLTRTVGVRVAVDNPEGRLRPGEFAKASIRVPLTGPDGAVRETVVLPRNSLLSVGETSLVYVEEKAGEFQLRPVTAAPAADGQVAIFDGVMAGENVVVKSAFLVDSHMQLQQNPSLIDPAKAVMQPSTDDELTDAERTEIEEAFEFHADQKGDNANDASAHDDR
jgi:Cu(I)/Ag(I) efflux system membrane fusion protein